MNAGYDAFLLVSFGGPECQDDVLPFLENVLRGKNVPRERMLEVAGHYRHFDGRSPINDHNRALIAALTREFSEHGPQLPIYWGNRNWHPLLPDTLARMRNDGIRRAVAFVTSAFGSYSGCRQYREDLDRARAAVGEGAPEICKLRTFHNHPKFIEVMADRVRAALEQIPAARRERARLVYTAHSIPLSMASSSPYVAQLEEARRLVDAAVGRDSLLAYQSRSGPPGQPWLEPDIGDLIRTLHADGALADLVVVPLGFLSDHMEVIYDLDTEASALCRELGVNFVRAGTAGVHPVFVSMIRDLVLEESAGCPDCAPDCCAPPRRPGAGPPVRSAAGG